MGGKRPAPAGIAGRAGEVTELALTATVHFRFAGDIGIDSRPTQLDLTGYLKPQTLVKTQLGLSSYLKTSCILPSS